MDSSIFRLFLISLLLFHQHRPSSANLYNSKVLGSELLADPESPEDVAPTTYFEVTKPIDLPKTKPCSHLVLQQDFAYTYGRPPVVTRYDPPSNCPSRNFSKIVLEWKATCKGRQFDRIFGVWLSGVELLRSCTAEPRATGIVWTVQKDVSRYSSLLMEKNQTLAVYLGNLVNKIYTGIYHVNVTLYFYPADRDFSDYDANLENIVYGNNNPADLILPVSRNMPLKSGLWFEIRNSSEVGVKEVKIPQNVYKAVLEVYVSFHENDEFWYGNYPNEYISANNLTSAPGNGPFREVVVRLDDLVVGAVWPFTVIFTGGVNPLLWRPITAIGSFDLPSYDIQITPFLGILLDGKTHKIRFGVANALNVWYINANMHLWLDKKSKKTEGGLLGHSILPGYVSLVSNFTGLNGTFLTTASRRLSATGWVKSSLGNATIRSVQEFNFTNSMELANEGNVQVVNQIIDFNDSVSADVPRSSNHSIKSIKRFPLYMYTNQVNQENKSYELFTNVTLGCNEERRMGDGFKFLISSLKNWQEAQGYMLVARNLVKNGLGSTQQVYAYENPQYCYNRNVSSWNYTILYDKVGNACSGKTQLPVAMRRPFQAF